MSPSVICDKYAFLVDLIQEIDSNGMGSPVSDFTDENFEEELAEACEENMDSMFCSSSYPAFDDPTNDKYLDIAKYGIVDVKGDDSLGRKIIVVYAYKLPPVKQIDHSRFLRYEVYVVMGMFCFHLWWYCYDVLLASTVLLSFVLQLALLMCVSMHYENNSLLGT